MYLLYIGAIKVERNSDLNKLILSRCSLTNQSLRTLSEKAPRKLNQLAYLDLSSNDQLTTECLSSICTLTSLGNFLGYIIKKIYLKGRLSFFNLLHRLIQTIPVPCHYHFNLIYLISTHQVQYSILQVSV